MPSLAHPLFVYDIRGLYVCFVRPIYHIILLQTLLQTQAQTQVCVGGGGGVVVVAAVATLHSHHRIPPFALVFPEVCLDAGGVLCCGLLCVGVLCCVVVCCAVLCCVVWPRSIRIIPWGGGPRK